MIGQGKSYNLTNLNSYTFDKRWDFLLAKSKNNKPVFYFFSETYYIVFGKFQNSKYNEQTNSIYIPFSNRFVLRDGILMFKLFSTYMKKFLQGFNYIFYKKLMYAGKGYRLYVRKKFFIYPKLNYSHKLFIYSFNTQIIITSRWTMNFFNKSLMSFNNFMKTLLLLRKYNMFTKKGIRLRKQILHHKIGKVSSY